jgi:MFS family permease
VNAPLERKADPEVALPSVVGRYYALVLLGLAYACAYLDRSVIGVVLPQLKHEFHFGDVGLGFLSGMAFVAFYVCFGLPVAVLADRSNRRNIIAVAIALWSIMTALCGLSGNFLQLALARVGVGVGEAGLSPPAQSMISDLFPHQRRATALSIYSIGIYLGVVVGLAYGGYLAEHLGWRRTFFVMAIPGVVVSIIFALTVREPKRGASEAQAEEEHDYRNMLQVLRFLWTTPSLRYTLLGITLCSLFTQGQAAWLPSFLVRSHGMTIAQAGLTLGLATGIGGTAGTLLGGQFSDRLGARDSRWRVWVITVAFIILPISALTFLYSGSTAVVGAMALTNSLLAAVHLAPTSAVTQNLTPLRMRARTAAITLFLTSLVGGGIGPLVVGALSDYLHRFAGANSLRYALTTMVVFALGSAAAYFVAGRKMPGPRSSGR